MREGDMHAAHSQSPHGFWREDIKTAICICNRPPQTELMGGIPEEVLSDKPTSYDRLCIFGSDAFVHIRYELWNMTPLSSTLC